jgi:hypothetical protein
MLPDSVISPQDIQALTLDVEKYANWFANATVKIRLKVGHRNAEQPEISTDAAMLIRDWATQKSLSSQSLDELITALKDFGNTALQLTIVLAAPPSSKLKKTLVNWFRHNLTANLLVDFQFRSSLLGGMVVQCGSHIFDWSFRRQILAASNKFPEVLRRV